ncbi:MAG: PAS domain S-box protein [Planctomycetes bacterium]|nr:PAS domain S-box protein [Planctomycetota bacterium]MCB9883850.1 PAS domain S-box protein [Planctomycetota bacterium]
MSDATASPTGNERTAPSLIPAAVVLSAGAGFGGSATLVENASPWHAVLWLAAGVALATGASLLWCRRQLRMWVTRASARAERERSVAAGAASAHAARWRAIVDTATEGIVTIDARGNIENVNGAAIRLFGYAESELVGRNVTILMPEPFNSEHDGYLRRYRQTGEKRIIGIGREVVGRRKDGSMFPIDLSVGEGWIGEDRFFTAVIRDITDRKQMQSKLAQTERLAAVGELAAGIAHEVNNPINTMINCAQLILDGDDPKENCQVVIEEGERIAEIVKDLLQFARDDQDRAQPTFLPDVVQRTLRLIGENFKRHGITLRVTVPEELPQVLARPQQIQQVLLNLLINAKDALLHHQCDVRQVVLSSEVGENGVELRVADNGPGIPESLGERVFEPFVTTKRARGGTGLGLSVSKSIVEGYSGTLAVETTPGGGATFRIWLPRTERAE